jgi:type VI secretion system protein VasI
MKCLGIFLVTTFCCASAASGQDTSSCISIDNDLDRLSCYDHAIGRQPEVLEARGNGAWNTRTEVSEFNDTTSVFLSVASLEPVSCGYSGSQKVVLFVRCIENTTSLIIATQCHVTSGFGRYGDVEIRIDQEKTRKLQFTESTNNRSLGLWNGSSAIPIIQSMFGAEQMLVRFTPYNENPVTAKFPISQLEDVVHPVRENCNW